MTVAISPAQFSSNNTSRIEDLNPKAQEFETFEFSPCVVRPSPPRLDLHLL